MSKIHVEVLMDKAQVWWDALGVEAENIIINEYMKAHKLKDEDIDW